MTDFALANKQDSKYFAIEREDNTVMGEVEGGYTSTRPRSTRKPRTTYSTGFTSLSQADMDTLQAFYDLVGKHTEFDYTHPTSAAVVVCRIVDWPAASYKGAGLYPLYDFGPIKIKEV